MKILIVATKAPWPPRDGGRLALLNTLRALTEAGHHCTLVAPLVHQRVQIEQVEQGLAQCCTPVLVAAGPRSAGTSVVRSLFGGQPFTVARHNVLPVARRVAKLLREQAWDVVHVEQMQAMAQVTGEAESVPVVLRQQNVESRLWTFAASFRGPVIRPFFNWEARRLAAWEGRVMRRAAATVVLSSDDAEHLRRLAAADSRIETVEVPFSSELAAAETRMPGRPAVVLLASAGWRPNVDAVRAFAGRWWPEVVRRAPDSRLHVFGIGSGGSTSVAVHWHPPPHDSREAFPVGAVAAIPSRHPTGVPIKGLEAWARGLPVVASPEAAVSLGAVDGEQLLVAGDAEAFADAVARLAEDDKLTAKLVAGGRAALRERHAPAVVAEKLTRIYESVL